MYKIIGADGKEYGPVNLQELRQWIADGRINEQTSARQEDNAEWKRAAEFPEIQSLFASVRTAAASRVTPPGTIFPPLAAPEQGLAVTSFVLGLLSIVCLGPLTGIPAIVCGHLAHGRARREPESYGGAGFAIAGLILGYFSLLMIFLVAGAMLPALAKAKGKAQSISCVNNMKQIGLAVKIWAVDHNDEYPFNMSTNSGGTFELCNRNPSGYEMDPAVHFQVLSNELSTPRILVCPADTGASAAMNFQSLARQNISYLLRTGTNVNETAPQEILAVCPRHGNVLRSDGSVQQGALPASQK